MGTQYDALLTRVNEINDIQKAAGLLNWDREVIMPQAGMQARIQQMTTLRKLTHEMSSSAEMGDLIAAAAAEVEDADPDSTEARLVAEVQRNYDRARKLPPDFVRRMSQVSGQARTAWQEARSDNNFAHFLPWLEQVIDLSREMADYYGYKADRYDALLDLFERGMGSADVRTLFDAVKEATVPLLQAIVARGKPVDDTILYQPFDVTVQQQLARKMAEVVGYDFDRGYLGTAVHPFASSFNRNDCRITSRWYPEFLNPGLFGTLHESGHAIYEQGTGEHLARTPLARGTSSGIHESQSRMFENIIGRSYGFWRTHYPTLQTFFPDQLGGVPLDAFYRAINKVQPSFIRVEADELTYNFHIILRFELEHALISGDLAPKDVPTAWNDKMQQLLGVTPPTDTEGCLQDIHWSSPMLGYFPTYALGNLYAAQLYEAALAQQPSISAELDNGDVSSLLAWLRKNIHEPGKTFPPNELIQRVTGRPLTHEPFVRYVTEKYSAIYDL